MSLRWLIRHGESTSNAGGRATTNVAEISLTDLGHRQAREAAARVARCPELIVMSPYRRAQQTAAPIIRRWPDAPLQIWPIQEFTYLAPTTVAATTPAERQPAVAAYWRRTDPRYIDGKGAESFVAFMDRVRMFHQRLTEQSGFVVAVGHGQFFGAYLLGLTRGYVPSAQLMRDFHHHVSTREMRNGQIVEVSAEYSPCGDT